GGKSLLIHDLPPNLHLNLALYDAVSFVTFRAMFALTHRFWIPSLSTRWTAEQRVAPLELERIRTLELHQSYCCVEPTNNDQRGWLPDRRAASIAGGAFVRSQRLPVSGAALFSKLAYIALRTEV